MNESLITLLDTTAHPYGFRFDWLNRLSDGLAKTAKTVPKITITTTDVHNAMECPGLWEATKNSNATTRRTAYGGQQATLTRQLARRWIQATLKSPVRPFIYVEAQLKDFSWMNPEQAQWIGQQQFEERIETVSEISTVLSRIEKDIECEDFKLSAATGMRQTQIEIGNLTLISDDVDLCVGTHEIEGEGAWAKTVLLSFVSDRPTNNDLEKLGFSAAMHAITTGCPPARVIAYGLFDGLSRHIDVDADWIGLQIGSIMATAKTISRIRNGEEPTYTPGECCERCPMNTSCEASGHGWSPF
jgi:hypothetical protein